MFNHWFYLILPIFSIKKKKIVPIRIHSSCLTYKILNERDEKCQTFIDSCHLLISNPFLLYQRLSHLCCYFSHIIFSKFRSKAQFFIFIFWVLLLSTPKTGLQCESLYPIFCGFGSNGPCGKKTSKHTKSKFICISSWYPGHNVSNSILLTYNQHLLTSGLVSN